MGMKPIGTSDCLRSVIAVIGRLDASVVELLRGDALLTGPPDWRHELPEISHATAQHAIGEAVSALETRLEQIAPNELAPQPPYHHLVRDAYPWCYLDFVVEAKVLSIVGEGVLPPERLAQLRRPWAAVFGAR